MRPGQTWFRLPLFIWSMYSTSLILVLATPVVSITLALLGFERVTGIGIFDPAQGATRSCSNTCSGSTRTRWST